MFLATDSGREVTGVTLLERRTDQLAMVSDSSRLVVTGV